MTSGHRAETSLCRGGQRSDSPFTDLVIYSTGLPQSIVTMKAMRMLEMHNSLSELGSLERS